VGPAEQRGEENAAERVILSGGVLPSTRRAQVGLGRTGSHLVGRQSGIRPYAIFSFSFLYSFLFSFSNLDLHFSFEISNSNLNVSYGFVLISNMPNLHLGMKKIYLCIYFSLCFMWYFFSFLNF
jgi:hypothetical protein